MQLDSLEPVLWYIFIQIMLHGVGIYIRNAVHCVKNLACGSEVDASTSSSIKTLSFEYKTPEL
jgi:hypothetical protein